MSSSGKLKPLFVASLFRAGDVTQAAARGHLDRRGRTSAVRWLLDPISHISAEGHAALIGDINISLHGISASITNFLLLNLICCWLTHAKLFFAFLAGNILLCILRVAAVLLVAHNPPGKHIWRTDFYILTTLLWCLLEGALTGAAVFSSIGTIQVLASAAALAPQGMLAARNFSAPRFAMAIIFCLDLPYVAGATFSPEHWLIAVLVLTPGYLIGTLTSILHFQRLAIENYVARFASQQQAKRDPLTGILNRRGMTEALEQGACLLHPVTLFCMDLDGFKQVNDCYGHPAGDLLLQLVTARLSEVARMEDSVARLGGDEFALIAPGLLPDDAEAVAARIVAAISNAPYILSEEGISVRIGVSVGYACGPEDAISIVDLENLADAALYAVKQDGKGSWQRAWPERTRRPDLTDKGTLAPSFRRCATSVR